MLKLAKERQPSSARTRSTGVVANSREMETINCSYCRLLLGGKRGSAPQETGPSGPVSE